MTTDIPYSPLNDLPGPYEVGNMLRILMGRTVTAWSRAEVINQVTNTDQVAVYVDDAGEIMSVCLCSLPLAAAVGSALSMLSPTMADEAWLRGQLPGPIQENHYEVMNICARFFNSPYSPHVRLSEVVQVDQGLSNPLRTALGQLGAWVQLDVTVEGYGAGTMLLAHVRKVNPDEPAQDSAESRQYPRATLSAEVAIALPDGDMVMGMARDLSVRSAYVICDRVPPMGTSCTLLLFAPTSTGVRKIKLGARIVRVDTTGMAAVFTSMDEETRDVIDELVAMREEPPVEALTDSDSDSEPDSVS